MLQLANTLTEKWRVLQLSQMKVKDLEHIVDERTADLLKSGQRFRLIAENAADLIAVFNKAGNCIYNSPSYQKILGFSAQEWSLTSADEQIHPEDRAMVMAAAQAGIKTGVSQILEYRMQHHDGSWRIFESCGSMARNACGEVENLVIVARDITERQQMETQLRQAQKLESIGQIAAGIAHEINTPRSTLETTLALCENLFVI